MLVLQNIVFNLGILYNSQLADESNNNNNSTDDF